MKKHMADLIEQIDRLIKKIKSIINNNHSIPDSENEELSGSIKKRNKVIKEIEEIGEKSRDKAPNPRSQEDYMKDLETLCMNLENQFRRLESKPPPNVTIAR